MLVSDSHKTNYANGNIENINSLSISVKKKIEETFVRVTVIFFSEITFLAKLF